MLSKSRAAGYPDLLGGLSTGAATDFWVDGRRWKEFAAVEIHGATESYPPNMSQIYLLYYKNQRISSANPFPSSPYLHLHASVNAMHMVVHLEVPLAL